MPLPIRSSVEVPLLYEIATRGGAVRPREIYGPLAKHFPEITEHDLTRHDRADNTNVWKKDVRFVRDTLCNKGELNRFPYGIWTITQKGRERLQREWPPKEPAQYGDRVDTGTPSEKKPGGPEVVTPTPGGVAPVSPPPQPAPTPVPPRPPTEPPVSVAESPIRENILAKLSGMNDRQFEEFVGRLLAELGYDDVTVVGRSGDGGVDVRCVLKAPLVEPPMAVVCQVKRHTVNIGPGTVGDLRGRWAHRADRLLLVNTAGFTQGAREAAQEAGAKEISLVTGEDLADLMIQRGIGVSKEPVVVKKLDEAFFSEFSR